MREKRCIPVSQAVKRLSRVTQLSWGSSGSAPKSISSLRRRDRVFTGAPLAEAAKASDQGPPSGAAPVRAFAGTRGA